MNIKLGIEYYNDIKNIIFNNFIIILVLGIFYYYYGFTLKTILLAGPILLGYYAVKQISKMFNILGPIHADQCLNYSSRIILESRIKPIEMRQDLLDTNLSNFWINSSHNTYVPCTQHVDLASIESIKYALKMGARVIELDCFMRNNKTNDFEPVITHGRERPEGDIFLTNYLTFEDAMKTISEYGFNTSDPLIICLELNTNKNEFAHQRMIDIIRKYIGNKLLSSEYKLSRGSIRKYVNDTPIRELLGKVIFLCGGGYTDNISEIIDGSFKEDKFGNISDTNTEVIKTGVPSGVIERVYPSGNVFSHLSYNYDPEPFWKAGCQIVALNFNKVDKNLIKNFEKFRDYSFVKKI